jgi:prepilin-type N-terminal cleavage/methylation domain-containing protein
MMRNFNFFKAKFYKIVGQINLSISKPTTAGFTLIELLAAITIIGVLAAIAAPSWVAFKERQRLNTANNQIYQALRQAQANAKLQKETWQVSFQPNPSKPANWEWAIHRATALPASNSSAWQKLPDNVLLRPNTGTGKTTLSKVGNNYQILFNYKGCPVTSGSESCTNASLAFAVSYSATNPPPRVVLANKNGGTNQRCVMILTRLGAMKSGLDEDCN